MPARRNTPSSAYCDESGKKKIDLESLAHGTMPPASNHFGMQVGGASLALLAISGEKWVDQKRIDTLLAVAKQSMIRNLSQGFGDGGFFAIGLGPVGNRHKAAMKWYYRRFLADADAEAGTPCDTPSAYPHVAVCALVNWPLDLNQRNPADVLPHCYRDSSWGFYAWRNRWQDGEDTVISVLTRRTSGYMSAKPDRSLCLNTRGQHLRWGTVAEGPARYWWASPQGETSSLTLSDGTCFGVDFTGASGADVMLATTGKAEGQSVKLAGRTLTFYFPTVETPPKATVRGGAVLVGRQNVRLDDGNLAFAVQGR